MISMRIKLIIYALLYLTLHVVYGKHIMTRKFSGSNSTNVDGINCYVCGLADEGSPAKHLSDCTDIQKCRPGEFCYLEHIYDLEKGTDYYVGGCRAPDTCHLQTCLKDQLSRRQDHTKLVHCSECCSSSYCNGKLCNLPNDHRLNFTTCYSCDNIRDPKQCHTIVDCPPNEICGVEAQAVGHSGSYILVYDLGCQQKVQCKDLPTLQKRQIQLQSKCCNTTLCNDHYKDGDHTKHIVRPTTFTCPPMPNTAAPTQKTTMTTTTLPTLSTTSTTSTTKTTTTATPTTAQTTPHASGQCRDKPGTGISCAELMSIRGFCTSLIADKYCAESCNHCTKNGLIMTPDRVKTGHILTTDPVIAGNFLTPDPQTIFGKK